MHELKTRGARVRKQDVLKGDINGILSKAEVRSPVRWEAVARAAVELFLESFSFGNDSAASSGEKKQLS